MFIHYGSFKYVVMEELAHILPKCWYPLVSPSVSKLEGV
jgi:hypothetical protein